MNVRIGSAEDREGLASLLRMMHQENGIAPLQERKMFHFLDRGLARDGAIIGVISVENEIRASVGLFTGDWWYSDEIHLEDLWNFVHPNHRRSSYANDLIAFSKHAADMLKIPLLMGILSTDRTEAKVRLYARQMPFAGAIFLHGVKTGDFQDRANV